MTDFVLPHDFVDRQGRTILVRRAREDDAAPLIEFIKQVDAESTFLSREPGEFAFPVATERLFIKQTNERCNSIFLVALDGDVVVGTIDFHGGDRARTRHTGEFGLSVGRAYWGSGVGSHLLDAMLLWARTTGQVAKVKLRVQAVNERAIALYLARGFVEEGRWVRELKIGGEWVDILCMSLWLEEGEK